MKARRLLFGFAAVLLIMFSAFWIKNTVSHHGGGSITVGGDVPGTGGAISTDERIIFVPENEYKRRNMIGGIVGLIIGLCLLINIINEYRIFLSRKNMSRIEQALRKYKYASLFDLYLALQFENPDSEDYKVISALIEVRKAKREFWTLVGALIAAVASVVALFLTR